jgi:hypothetical protein
MTTVEDITRDFVAGLQAWNAERINGRLRDLLALGLVSAPARERAAMQARPKRKYTKSAKWRAALRARRAARKAKAG